MSGVGGAGGGGAGGGGAGGGGAGGGGAGGGGAGGGGGKVASSKFTQGDEKASMSPADIMEAMFRRNAIRLDPDEVHDKIEVIKNEILAAGGDRGDGINTFDVFISYRKSSDIHTARLLHEKLEAVGVRAFLDERDLQYCREWKDAFLRSLSNSNCFLALMSRAGLAKARDDYEDHTEDNVLIEYQSALSIQKDKKAGTFIIPVFLGSKVSDHMLIKFDGPDLCPSQYASHATALARPAGMRISGAAGDIANRVNGVYKLDGTSGGMPLYRKNGGQQWLEYHVKSHKWISRQTCDKGQANPANGDACVICPPGMLMLPHKAPARAWEANEVCGSQGSIRVEEMSADEIAPVAVQPGGHVARPVTPPTTKMKGTCAHCGKEHLTVGSNGKPHKNHKLESHPCPGNDMLLLNQHPDSPDAPEAKQEKKKENKRGGGGGAGGDAK